MGRSISDLPWDELDAVAQAAAAAAIDRAHAAGIATFGYVDGVATLCRPDPARMPEDATTSGAAADGIEPRAVEASPASRRSATGAKSPV